MLIKTFILLKKGFLFLFLSMVLISCEDFYNPDVQTRLPENKAYSDYLASRAAVNGLYALMQDVMEAYVVNGELKGDLLTLAPGAEQDLQDIYYHNYHIANKYIDVMPFYRIISNANDVIYHLNILRENGTSYDEELNSMYTEAVLVRSWVYFYLIRNYRNIPYLEEDYTTTNPGISPEEWLSDQMNSDVALSELISGVDSLLIYLLPETNSNTEFFNMASGWAFLGEMYLWDNNYENCVDALITSVESAENSRFILDSDLENAKWVNIFKGDQSGFDEIMTKIVYNKGEKQENNLLELFSSIAAGGSELLPVEYIQNDLKGTYRYEGSLKDGEVGKYTRSLESPYTSDMPVLLYRAADVHLMLAEAYNRMGETDIALDLVNNGSDSLFTAFSKGVRGRIRLDPLTIEGETKQDSIIDLENKILEERARELTFEGKRWYDLVRIAERRDNPAFLTNKMTVRYQDVAMAGNYYSNPENWYYDLTGLK